MTALPIITGFGGFNAAGRSSFHQGYRRMIIESLASEQRQETLAGLGIMMGLFNYVDGGYQDASGTPLSLAEIETQYADKILNGTLIRRIEKSHFDVDAVQDIDNIQLNSKDTVSFELTKHKLPDPLPEDWQIEAINDKKVRVHVNQELAAQLKTARKMDVSSAGILPSGFNPGEHYRSLHHPRGLQMTVMAASDAVNSLGIEWQTILDKVAPDEIAVYGSSGLAQMDENGMGGLMQARLRGQRVSSKQLALGFNSMPADFVNAYILGNIGTTGCIAGACATLLYNLRFAVDDIKSGRRRVVIIGCSEAPVLPEIIDGFDSMSALGKDSQLAKIDQQDTADNRRASRPFGENCGFTIAESAQYFILMDDALVMELGAKIYAGVNDVFVNADGFKKSISAPGPGNYITLAKAVASAESIVGKQAIQEHSFVQAHGSSTPQNRVTESVIFDKVAEHFGISSWPISAVKAYVGHSLGPASGDQLSATLGVFADGYLPGIKTIDKVADDVVADRLAINTQDEKLNDPQVAFLNSKGFGGNNASASVLSPSAVKKMLAKRYDADTLAEYESKLTQTEAQAERYNQHFLQGDYQVIYNFGKNLVDESQIAFADNSISIPGYADIQLLKETLYEDIS